MNIVQLFCHEYEKARRFYNGNIPTEKFRTLFTHLHENVKSDNLWLYFFNEELLSFSVATTAIFTDEGQLFSMPEGLRQSVVDCPDLVIEIPNQWWEMQPYNVLYSMNKNADDEDLSSVIDNYVLLNNFN